MSLAASRVFVIALSVVLVSAASGSVMAQCSPPVIDAEPVSTTVPTGQPATFIVQASGTGPLSYQWFLGIPGDISTPVGTSSPVFTTGAITSPVEVWVQVNNACGMARSLGAVAQANCFLVAPDVFGPPIIGPGVPYEVTWTSVPGASLYEIQESTSPDFSSASIFTTRLNSARYTHNAAPSEIIPYFYRVRVTFNWAAAPILVQSLKANEFVQLNSVMSSRLGIENAYNARVTVRVIGGSGKVAAYASIIDNLTQDPTYVPSQ